MRQLELRLQTKKRDRALDLLEEHRANLIERAKQIAYDLVKRNGRVTGPQVMQELRAKGYGKQIDSVDKRFMGAVFRAGNGWERVGFENLGSHRQPISVWRLKR